MCAAFLTASAVAMPVGAQTLAPAEGRTADTAERAPTADDGEEEEEEVMEGPAPLPREATTANEERQEGDEVDPLNGSGGNTDWVGSGGN